MAEDERCHFAILERSAGLLDLMEWPPQVSEETLTAVEAKIAAAETGVERSELSSDEAFSLALSLEEFAALANVFAGQERSLVLTGHSV